jgi:RHS repeat-associated protein
LSGALTGGTNAIVTQTPTPVYSYSITGYDPDGNLLSYTDSVMGSWSFGYDPLNRLTSAAVSSGYYNTQANIPVVTLGWTYDEFGNRLTQSSNSAALPTGSTQFAANNQATGTGLATSPTQSTTTLQYDAAGNLNGKNGNLQSIYDAEGRLCATPISSGGYEVYTYDAEGNRVAKGTNNTLSCDTTASGYALASQYLLGPSGEQMTELNSAGAWVHTNVMANGSLIATFDNDSQGAHFYLTDWLGTRRVQTNYIGAVESTWASLPYGEEPPPLTSDPTEHHFTGKERDAESGNDYFGARYYASTMGRFLSPDWSAKAEPVPYAKLENPQTLNLYAYVGNNPLIRTDPTGHYVCSGSKEQCAQIQDGLNAAKAAQAKLGADSKEGKAIGAVLKFYGAAGEKNGVGVSFGNLAKGTLGETSFGANGSVNIKFDLKQIDSFGRQAGPLGSWTERSATEIHEGRHGEDARVAGHGPENRHEEMQTERNAYRTQSYVYQGLGVETLTGLWSPSWSPAAAEQNRNAAVQEGAERSTNTACAQGCQP